MKIINAIHAQCVGGVDQVFKNYTEILAKDGHEVALLISDNGNCKYEFAKKIFKLKNHGQVFDFLNLLRIVLYFKPNIIICHSNRLMKWMRFIRLFSSVKSVAVNHGISFKNSLYCDYVISINQQIANLVVEAGFPAKNSFILPNVIKIDQLYLEKKLKPIPTIAIYGRVEPRKGFDILIKACEILAERKYDFKLKIGGFEVGAGYGWKNIQDLAKSCKIFDKCEFYGLVVDKKKFFEDVDIFCVPSREEPFGLVILESFLYSTLVISSNSDGGKLLITDGENGFLFENENFAELAEKISKIIDNSVIYSDITAKAFARLEKESSFDVLGRKMNKILSEIIL